MFQQITITAYRRARQAEGRKVRIVKPNQPGKDFNDILQARKAGKAVA